jgi:erythromycin esterase
MFKPIKILLALTLVANDAAGQAIAPVEVDTSAIRAEFREQAIRHPRTVWLRQNVPAIRTIDPQDDDFSDLEPLRGAIGSARVVMLGEQTHGDGSTFLAKARLIQFLHQEMGFDVLAFESPMYDLSKAWQEIERGALATDALRAGVFGTGPHSDQFGAVVEYLEQTVRTDRPLILAGFDSQSHTQFSRDSLAIDLQRFLHWVGMDPAVLDEGEPLRDALRELTHYRPIESWVVDTLTVLAAEVTKRTAELQYADTIFLRQILMNLPAYARQVHLGRVEMEFVTSGVAREALSLAMGSIRGEQMGKNVLWLAENRYPERKIIVWASSIHTRYRGYLLDDPGRGRASVAIEEAPMGQWVRAGMGESVYSIMFTSYTGAAYAPRWGSAFPYEIHTDYNARPELDFEDWMNAADLRYAFVDLRHPTGGGEWLRNPFIARPHANTSALSPWSENTDALFFIQRNRSATWGCPLFRERELGLLPLNNPSVPDTCLVE